MGPPEHRAARPHLSVSTKAIGLIRRALSSPVTVYLGVAVLCRGVGFFLIPLYTRRLSLEQYGDLALAQSAVALLPMVLTFGIVSAVPRAFFREQSPDVGLRRAGDVAAWAVVLALLAAGIVELLIIAFVPPSHGATLGRFEASCALVASLGAAFTAVPSLLFRAAQKALAAAMFQALEAFSIAGFTVYFVALRGLGLRGAILGLMLAYLLNGLVALGIIFIHLGGRPRRHDLRDLLRFSFPFVPHHASNWAQAASDRWVLKGSGFDAALGAFSLASQLLSPAIMTMLAFHDFASARMGEAFRSGGVQALREVCRKQRGQYLLSALLPALAVILALPIIPYVVGRSFSAAFWTIPVLVAIALVDTQYYPHSNVLYFAERTHLIPRVTVASAMLNVVLNVLLIPRLGLAGALIARAATVVLRAGAFIVLARGILAGCRQRNREL